ncbi:hypothetical protein [Vibrio sp. D431a]|uniref:hypothetical protein n=1 Tax=Vibrio sp. D431a TaxID=2837388 RepID=UPI002553174F|nr:hypothetical protein [Vibrio sp. D431a]MDK9790698.1 hypothetical protein [Vibrio sp. D431a]
MSNPKSIDLSNFSETKPDGAHYWKAIQNSINNLLSDEHEKGFQNLPHPKRLEAEKLLVPSYLSPEHIGGSKRGDLSTLLNMSYMFFKGSFFDVDAYTTITLNRFPYINDMLNSHGVDPHNVLVANYIEHYHHFHNDPIVEYTDGLIGLLNQTSLSGIDKIPVRLLRSPYKSMYLDFRNAPQLPTLDDQKICGAYVYETSAHPKDLGDAYMEYMRTEPSLKRLSDSGNLDDSEELVCLSILLIAYPEGIKTIDDGCYRTTFSFMFNANADDDISIGDIVTGHTGGMTSEEDFNFTEMNEPLGLVFNSLLYMNSTENERKVFKEGTELAIKTKQIKNPKKLRKMERQILETYDFVRIGKTYNLEGVYSRTSGGWKVSPHIRRGHFRKQRYGKDRSLTRVQWIMPTAIGGDGTTPSRVKVQ